MKSEIENLSGNPTLLLNRATYQTINAGSDLSATSNGEKIRRNFSPALIFEMG
jgi:hypothetical protein